MGKSERAKQREYSTSPIPENKYVRGNRVLYQNE